MQPNSTTTSSSKTTKSKVTAKPRGGRKPPPTLHLKDKHLVSAEPVGELASRIATAAYYRAEQRGFEPGHELEDWLHAEQQVRLLFS